MWDRFVCFIFGNKYWSRVTTTLINCNNPLGFAVGGLFWFSASGARSGFNHWLMDLEYCLEARDVECITFDVTKTISREYEIIKGYTIFSRGVIVVLLRYYSRSYGWIVLMHRAFIKDKDENGEKERACIAEVTAKLDEIERQHVEEIKEKRSLLGMPE